MPYRLLHEQNDAISGALIFMLGVITSYVHDTLSLIAATCGAILGVHGVYVLLKTKVNLWYDVRKK